MPEFRDMLVALGRGQVTLDEVVQSIDDLMKHTPEQADAVRKLLDSASKGGLPDKVHARLAARLTSPDVGDATVMAGVDGSGEGATVAVGAGGEDATVMANSGGGDDATQMSSANASEDATVMSGAQDDATEVMAENEDATAISGGNEDATQFSGGASDGPEATMYNASRDGDSTQTTPADGDRTMMSVNAIDRSFDESNLAAAQATDSQSNSVWENNVNRASQPAGPVTFGEGSILRNRFKLETKLGEGGMGTVWKGVDKLKEEARDRNPYVAIKLLQGDFRHHPEAFIALQRETAKQQRLAHPNIATVFDFDRDDDTNTVFMTMEVMSGDDLAAHIRRNLPPDGLPYEEAMVLIEQLGNGLAYAHQAGLVHSDLKPGNCFLTDEHTVKLLDFGIARASKTKADAQGESTVFDPGELGALTPGYATIEMFNGEDPDPRDDIYAMAIISYQLLTGKVPFGRGVNAVQAETRALVMPPLDKLTKAQNRALARGLAFRREDRSETVEDFLVGLRPKKRNITLIAVPIAIAVAAILGLAPVINNYLGEQERNTIIQSLQFTQGQHVSTYVEDVLKPALDETAALSADQKRLVLDNQGTRTAIYSAFAAAGEKEIQSLRNGLKSTLGEEFEQQILNIPDVEDSVVALYEKRANELFDPAKDKLDILGAREQVEQLRNIVPRAAGVITLETKINTVLSTALRSLEKRFGDRVKGGDILPGENGDDIFSLRDRIALLDPKNSILSTPTVSSVAGRLAQSAFNDSTDLEGASGQAKLENAAGLLAASLQFGAQFDNNANLRYEVKEALRQKRNEAKVAAIEEELAGVQSTFSSLAGFQAVRDQLTTLADLAPKSPVLQGLQSNLTDAFDVELNKQVKTKNWPAAEQLLVNFSRLFSLDYLHERREQLSEAERAAGANVALSPRSTAMVAERRATVAAQLAVEAPEFGGKWETDLQVPFKELVAILPAGDQSLVSVRQQIANLYIAESESARASRLTTRARTLIERGSQFYPAYPEFATQAERITEIEAVIEAERIETERLARVNQSLKEVIDNATLNLTADAEAALKQLQEDIKPEENEKLSQAQGELARAFGRLAETPANKEEWGPALALVTRALELSPNEASLSTQKEQYQAEYDKVAAVEQFKQLLRGKAPLAASVVDRAIAQVKADFPDKYGTTYATDFSNAAVDRLATLPIQTPKNLTQIASEVAILSKHFKTAAATGRKRLAPRLAKQTRDIESKSGAVKANAYLLAALKVAPGASALTAIELNLPSQLAEKGKALVKAGKLTEAIAVLAQVQKDSPKAPNLAGFRNALAAKKQLAERSYIYFTKFKKRRLAKRGKPYLEQAIGHWADNADYLAELSKLKGPPTPSSRYACSANKAGQGRSPRATCFDEFGGKRGPVMVVVPPGGGNSNAFAIGKLEVTVSDYNIFCSTSGCSQKKLDSRLPLTGISLKQAESYASWLSGKTGATYRLPTESEWEHAANAGGKQPRKDFNCKVTVGSQTLKGQSLVTALSGKANGWGLINYVGNAKEWVKSGGSLTARGGSFGDPMAKCDISLREAHSGGADQRTGFRLVRELG
ncbi:MAG: protein kinase [Chromatiales bacterium]|nr:protein kinase [Chromatiales bacterium]